MIRRAAVVVLCLAPALSGCATMANSFEDEPRNKVYVGVRQDLTGWTFAHGGFIDLPFSFVADTILLPYTIPRTIWSYATAEQEAPEDDKASGSSG